MAIPRINQQCKLNGAVPTATVGTFTVTLVKDIPERQPQGSAMDSLPITVMLPVCQPQQVPHQAPANEIVETSTETLEGIIRLVFLRQWVFLKTCWIISRPQPVPL